MKNQLSNTFSIVVGDPAAGACGAAGASKFPAVGKVVPYVRTGVGAFVLNINYNISLHANLRTTHIHCQPNHKVRNC